MRLKSPPVNFYNPYAISQKMVSMETSISIVEGDINLLASKDELTILQNGDKTMYSWLSEVDISLDGINLSVSNSEYKTMDGVLSALSSAESQIQINADNINLKVSEVTDRIQKAESQIAVNSNDISLKVSESDITGNYLIGKINLSSTTAQIAAQHVNLQGAVSITDFNTSLSSDFNALKSWSYGGNLTYIDGGNIYSRTVTTDKLAANSVTANELAANSVTSVKIAANAITANKIATDAIKSRNYVAGSTGSYLNLANGTWDSKNFKLTSDGSMTATNGNFSGVIKLYDDGADTAALQRKLILESDTVRHSLTSGSLSIDAKTSNVTSYFNLDSIHWYNNCFVINGISKTLTTNLNATFQSSVTFSSAVSVNARLNMASHIYIANGQKVIWGNNAQIFGNGSGHLFLMPDDNGNHAIHIGSRHEGLTYSLDPDVSDLIELGSSDNRWNVVYAASSAIDSSDRNFKKDIEPIPDQYKQVFFNLEPVIYRFINGTSGRIHTGFISQDAEQALLDQNMTTMDWAAVCKDQKSDGSGYIYSLRYSEIIPLNTLMIQEAYKRIEQLEKTIQSMQEKLN